MEGYKFILFLVALVINIIFVARWWIMTRNISDIKKILQDQISAQKDVEAKGEQKRVIQNSDD